MSKPPWSHTISMGQATRGATRLRLEADQDARRRIARLLDLAELKSLNADVSVSPWFDGAEVNATWAAELVQTCGVTLEPLESRLDGHFIVRVVPPGSLHAPDPEAEITIDIEADDPPDVLEGDDIDLAHYVVEHLSLDVDPFPRKPGVEFEPPQDNAELSPFAVLRQLHKPEQG